MFYQFLRISVFLFNFFTQICVGDIGDLYKVRLIVDGKGATTAINMLKVCSVFFSSLFKLRHFGSIFSLARPKLWTFIYFI